MNRLFEWCVLIVEELNGKAGIVYCPTEWAADGILEQFNGFLAVKYPTKRLL